ncbi:uncharacterized protein LOC133873286 [Alnus glutinosa]|uniref:uncharacterized protein LOC133873286 n=1 Tax=Alnus glutinosa TaxID=3517 RepID=UPI002D7683DE|nr:uncharacterized protein LOC133873286 [Alnus glutinosa]
MASSKFVVEVHFGGRFDWSFGCVYLGGEIEVHKVSVDLDKLSYFEIENICKEYGYKAEDLMYFKDPAKSLADGLHLITYGHDVLFLSYRHTGHVILELYIVTFGDGGDDEEDSEEDEEYGDLFDVDVGAGWGDGGAGPSNVQPDNPNVKQGNEEGNEWGNDESSEEGSNNDSEDDVDHTEAGHAGKLVSGENLKRTFEEVEDVDDDDTNSDMGRSDIFVSPVASDEEVEIPSARRSEFHSIDLGDPTLELEMKFSNIQTFREAVRVFNLKRGKDITFKRNERQNYIIRWRVDVNPSMMYRAKSKANRKIYGKQEGQYARLWNYCETLRATNLGSCVEMKVDRPVPEVNPRFLRPYCSLAAMKKGFMEGCRPVIGVDGCFLKGPFKGQLLAVVGRDGNKNMYPIAYAVLEVETKDIWIWFLETLVSDLGSH